MTRLAVIALTLLLLAIQTGTAAAQTPDSIGPDSPLHSLDLAVESANEEITGLAFGPGARAHRQVTHAEERIAEMRETSPAAAPRAASLYAEKMDATRRLMERAGTEDPVLRDRVDATTRRGDEAIRALLDSDRVPDSAKPGLRAALERTGPAETQEPTPTPRPTGTQAPENRSSVGNATTPGNATPANATATPRDNETLDGNATPGNATD